MYHFDISCLNYRLICHESQAVILIYVKSFTDVYSKFDNDTKNHSVIKIELHHVTTN